MVLSHEVEFQQACDELLAALGGAIIFEEKPEYLKVIPIVTVPERIIQFRVIWENDNGKLEVNNGYRVQFNSALGPYKGGLRFHPTVNLSILKFLGFEQIFKNALTGLSMGGAKGGSDFNPKGKSDNEIRRFCFAFMRQLARYIGQDTDIPAGDIGVGTREIGFLFGAYKQIQNNWSGILTGKGLNWGGSCIRPEATGYGLVYFVEKMLEKVSKGVETLKGKKVSISGSGNVAQYTALKIMELGGLVISLSDSKGCIVSQTGIELSQLKSITEGRLRFKSIKEVIEENNEGFNGNSNCFTYWDNSHPWKYLDSVDIALPCATQNEISANEANHLIKSGCKIIAEGSNMASTSEAVAIFEENRSNNVWYAPGKAANCGGVAVSGLEMAQNSQRVKWTAEEVNNKLKEIMSNCFNSCYESAIKYCPKERNGLPSLLKGANIAGFIKVADAMLEQGDVY